MTHRNIEGEDMELFVLGLVESSMVGERHDDSASVVHVVSVLVRVSGEVKTCGDAGERAAFGVS